MKRPAFQFYPADWRKDPCLSVCSLSARGLWIELMCIAHESAEYGVLSINGKAMTDQQIARSVGESASTVAKLLAELEQAGVFSRDDKGAIFSRRMRKDEHIREVRAQSGRLGGNPNLLKQTGKQTGKQSPTPSSSSSSSTSKHSDPSDRTAGAVEAIDVVFGNGVALLTAAGVTERNARSMLGLMRKQHGDEAVAEALTRCAEERPLEPVPWLQAALKPKVRGTGKQATLEARNAAAVDEFVRQGETQHAPG